MKIRPLEELTIKDSFMFAAAMTEDPENCRECIERALGIKIERVKVSKEKKYIYNPKYKGIRLDVYAEDENHTHYDVEMQVARECSIEKRSRYYHSQMDMDLLLTGRPYEDLPDAYVIFICDYDPFGLGKYRYTVKETFEEESKEARELEREEARAKGVAEGHAAGIEEKLLSLIQKKLLKGKTIERIADEIEEPVERVEELMERLEAQ